MSPQRQGWNEHIRAADAAQRDGKYDYAEAMWMLAVGEAESFGRADRRLAYSLEKLTECLWFEGRLREARQYGTRALKIYEEALGPGHADVGSMAYNLAMAHHMLGTFDEAERLYKRALAVKTNTLGAKHPEVVKVLGSFADLLHKLGREDEARQLRTTERMVTTANWSQTGAGRELGAQQGLQAGDSARTTAAVSYPPDTLSSPAMAQPPGQPYQQPGPPPEQQQSTSGPYFEAGPPGGRSASGVYQQSGSPPLPHGQPFQQAGPPPGQQQSTSGSYPQAGAAGAPQRSATGNFAPPTPGQPMSGAVQQSVPPQGAGGPGSSQVASQSIMSRLQAIKQAAKLQTTHTNSPPEAESLCGAQAQARGANTVAGQHLAAQAASRQGVSLDQPAPPRPEPNPAPAVKPVQHEAPSKAPPNDYAGAAAKLAKPVSGTFGKTWDEIKDTAEQALQSEDHQKAESAWRECLTLARGDDSNNPCYCFVLEKLGEVYIRNQQFIEAEDCFRTSYNIKKAVLGDSHQAVVSAISNLARLYFTNNNYANAESYGEECVKINDKVFGPNSVEVAAALHNLATVYHVQRKYEKAEPHYERAMKLKQLLLGGDHPETVKLLKAYANLLRSTPREEQAEHLDQCVTGMISGRWRVLKTPEATPEENWWKQEIFGQE